MEVKVPHAVDGFDLTVSAHNIVSVAVGAGLESPRKLLSHVPKHEETPAPQGGSGFRVLGVNQTELREGLLSWMNGAGGHGEQPQMHLREVCRNPTAIAGYGSTEGGGSGQMAHGSRQCPPKL